MLPLTRMRTLFRGGEPVRRALRRLVSGIFSPLYGSSRWLVGSEPLLCFLDSSLDLPVRHATGPETGRVAALPGLASLR